MKKHLNRIAVDLCTPTAERRPTTAEDIRNDVFIEDFRNSEELYEFVLDLTNMDDEDVIYELDGDDTVENKIKYLLGFCTDPGDGSPNIQYCCVDGKELDNVLTYDAFDDVDFDDADSETLVDILLDEYEYSEDDDDEWDDDEWDNEDEDDLNEEKEKKKNLNKGETKMIDNKIKRFAELLEKNGFEDNGMDASFEVNDKDVAYKDQGGYFSLTLVDKEEEIYLFKERDYETNHSYTLVIRGDEQFEDFLKDFKRNHVLDNDLNEGKEDEVDNKTEKFWYEVHSDEDENNIYRIFYDRDEALKYARDNIEEGTWVDEIAYYGDEDEDDEDIDSSNIISINTIWTYTDDEDDLNEEVDVDSVDKKLMDRLIRKVRRAMDEGQYYLEPTKEELKRFITILIEERGMDDWEGEDWELLADSFFDHKEDSLDEILEWDYDINLDEVE